MRDRAATGIIHAVFVTSGISALLYQLVWQRSLLVLYGSNSESVAMVVAAFLVGLGLGSLVGGRVSSRPAAPLVLLFAAAEYGIGLYGLVSLRVFHWVWENTLYVGTWATGALAFAVVLFPTLLMGATLPVLVAYRVRICGQVGRAVSWLYFVNTLGAALGAFAAPLVFLKFLGLTGSVLAAATFNLLAGTAILLLWLARRAAR